MQVARPSSTLAWLPPLVTAAWAQRGLGRARAGAAALRRRLSGLTPERLFVLVLALGLAGFFLALLLQPGAVGRGGR
ncbi:MAG: hypothetical protein U0104_12225 [Gemmatimonadales bacterium]